MQSEVEEVARRNGPGRKQQMRMQRIGIEWKEDSGGTGEALGHQNAETEDENKEHKEKCIKKAEDLIRKVIYIRGWRRMAKSIAQ